MPRPVHFEIHADDTERASRFYSTVFGWNIHKWDGPEEYWLATTGEDGEPGINGAIMERPDPAVAGMNYIGVDSVDEFTEKVVAGGGKVVMPKMAIPGVGYAAACSDTEGNHFGLFQDDPSAA